MTYLAPWQRTLYFLGEVVMVAGLLWGLWRIIIVRGCPVTPFNDITLIVLGLAISTIPLHPFGSRAYMQPALRRAPTAAVLWWLIALIGLGYSLFLRFSSPVPVGLWWFAALIPAVLYFWLAIPSKLSDQPIPATRAPTPPEGAPEIADEMENDGPDEIASEEEEDAR